MWRTLTLWPLSRRPVAVILAKTTRSRAWFTVMRIKEYPLRRYTWHRALHVKREVLIESHTSILSKNENGKVALITYKSCMMIECRNQRLPTKICINKDCSCQGLCGIKMIDNGDEKKSQRLQFCHVAVTTM
jgi:hypothetical protein